MVEETIQVIRETEAKADAIVKEAEARCKTIVEDASTKAGTLKEEMIQAANAHAEAMMKEAEEQGVHSQSAAMHDVDEQISKLKESAVSRENEAVDLVISQLV